MKYRIVTIFLSIVCLTLLVNFGRSFFHLGNRGDILSESQKRLIEYRQKRDALERKLAGATSSAYVEKQAREKLNLSKEGEVVVLLPQISLMPSPTPIPPDTRSNIQKWVEIFTNPK